MSTHNPVRIAVEQVKIIARTERWAVAVGRLGDRWIGFGRGVLRGGGRYMHVIPEVSDRDYTLGVVDREQAIRMTSAILSDPEESGFGEVMVWMIPRDQRGDLEAYRCDVCGETFCCGNCLDYDHEV